MDLNFREAIGVLKATNQGNTVRCPYSKLLQADTLPGSADFEAMGFEPDLAMRAATRVSFNVDAALAFHQPFFDFLQDKGNKIVAKLIGLNQKNIFSAQEPYISFCLLAHVSYIWLGSNFRRVQADIKAFDSFSSFYEEMMTKEMFLRISKPSTDIEPQDRERYFDVVLAAGYEPLLAVVGALSEKLRSDIRFQKLLETERHTLFMSITSDLSHMAHNLSNWWELKKADSVLTGSSEINYGYYPKDEEDFLLVDYENLKVQINPAFFKPKTLQNSPGPKTALHTGCLAAYIVSDPNKTTLLNTQTQFVFEQAFKALLSTEVL